MSASIEQVRAMRDASKQRSAGSGQVIEFDAKVKVTVNPGASGNSLLASTIVLEDLGIRLHGFRMNFRDGRLVPFFPGQNQDDEGNRYVDIAVDSQRAPFDLVVLANEKERVDPASGRTYRARTNVHAIDVNGGRLAAEIVDRYVEALESGKLPVREEEMQSLADSAVAAEA